jgi:hypothetical protein
MAHFKKGDHKAVCDLSGAVVNASDCRMMWNGLFVHKSMWEPRHPQDRPGNPRASKPPAIARPEGEMQFIAATDVTAGDL